ncbi:DNA-directed RNA polymerase subunit alpha, partial [Priestia megaterium]
MIEIEKPKIETVEISDDRKYGKFVVEPLERGYGQMTLSSEKNGRLLISYGEKRIAELSVS